MFTTWAPYALVGAGATGIWLMQSAFSAGPLQLSLPAISAGEPVVGILLGVLVFGDRIQISPGELALQAGGIFALIVGVIMVGRAPALSQLRTWTPPGLPHIAGSLPALPGIPGLAGRHSSEDQERDTPPDEPPNSDMPPNSHMNPNSGNGRAAGEPSRAVDNEPADRPNPLTAPRLTMITKDLHQMSCGSFMIMGWAGVARGRSGRNGCGQEGGSA
jgi:hypothetical protein